MDALRQRRPVEALSSRVADGHDDLAVEQARSGQYPRARVDQFGEVAGERLGAARSDLELRAVPGDQGAVR